MKTKVKSNRNKASEISFYNSFDLCKATVLMEWSVDGSNYNDKLA